MMRATTVLISKSRYVPGSEKVVTKFENVNMLAGPKDSVNAIKNKID